MNGRTFIAKYSGRLRPSVIPISARMPYVRSAPSAPKGARVEWGTNGARQSATSTEESAVNTTRPTSHWECRALGFVR